MTGRNWQRRDLQLIDRILSLSLSLFLCFVSGHFCPQFCSRHQLADRRVIFRRFIFMSTTEKGSISAWLSLVTMSFTMPLRPIDSLEETGEFRGGFLGFGIGNIPNRQEKCVFLWNRRSGDRRLPGNYGNWAPFLESLHHMFALSFPPCMSLYSLVTTAYAYISLSHFFFDLLRHTGI